MQARDHGRVNVLGNHEVVTQVERRRIDPAGEEPERIGEVRPVVRHRATVRQVYGHAMTASGSAGALPIVRRQRWSVAHQDSVELADVYPELERRGTYEG